MAFGKPFGKADNTTSAASPGSRTYDYEKGGGSQDRGKRLQPHLEVVERDALHLQHPRLLQR